MIKHTKAKDAQKQREIERLKAEQLKQEAKLEYVAMMADVELPEEETDEQLREED